MKLLLTAVAILGVVSAAGCSTYVSESPQTDSTSHQVSFVNGLSYNRLTFNRITFNRLTFNRLAINRLANNRLTFNSLDDFEATPEGRDLLFYIAICALNEGDILVAEHDGVTHEFPGLLGLAPEWEHRGLNSSEERMVSACLIAHVNAHDVSVAISLRAPGALDVDQAEKSDYPVYEATFFGNVFGEELETYACIGDLPGVAAAHSEDRHLRVCSDPGDDCQVISLGRCRDVCETRTPGHGWQDCWAGGQRYSETISAYLHDADLDNNNHSCGPGERCHLRVAQGRDGILDCTDARKCQADCKQGAICTLDGTRTERFAAEVKQGALADVNCQEAGHCEAKCLPGSTCEIDCKDAGSCRQGVRCQPGARCLLSCTGAADCGFVKCHGVVRTCPGDVLVCNRPCP